MHEHHNHEMNHIKPKRSFGDFVPLIIVFLVIIGFTWITLGYNNDFSIYEVARLFMGYFFLVFGLFKVLKWKGFVDAYATYDLIAMKSRFYGYIYPLIELALAGLYLFGIYLFYANIITLVIMLISALGVYLKLRKREEIQCACLGVVFKIPMTYVTLGEDLLMAIMAIVMLMA